MTTFALNNLWSYIQKLSLSQSDKEWLANKLIMPIKPADTSIAEERKAQFLKLAGTWSESTEGEEYYEMMRHRNDERPSNRTFPYSD